jgi:hypothetical protein
MENMQKENSLFEEPVAEAAASPMEMISKPVEEVPVRILKEESLPVIKRKRCPRGQHRSKKHHCKKVKTPTVAAAKAATKSSSSSKMKKCPPHKFRSAITHRCRHRCSKNHHYSKTKKRCVKKLK